MSEREHNLTLVLAIRLVSQAIVELIDIVRRLPLRDEDLRLIVKWGEKHVEGLIKAAQIAPEASLIEYAMRREREAASRN